MTYHRLTSRLFHIKKKQAMDKAIREYLKEPISLLDTTRCCLLAEGSSKLYEKYAPLIKNWVDENDVKGLD